MKQDYLHSLFSSFSLWFDHTLLQNGGAFTNISGRLYNMADPGFSGAAVYSSPYKQWVYDSSVSGSQVPSGVYVNGSFITRGTSGMFFDFQNGRAIFPSGLNSYNVTAAYSSKEFNIYTTTRSDSDLIFETRFLVNPTIPQLLTGSTPDQIIAPAIFLKIKGFNNDPFSFGGQESSNVNLRAIMMADSEFNLNAVGAVFTDTVRSNFLILNNTPINRYLDIKSGYYNYVQTACSGFSPENLVFIDKVSFTRLAHETIATKYPDLYVGFIDINVSFARFPRGNPPINYLP